MKTARGLISLAALLAASTAYAQAPEGEAAAEAPAADAAAPAGEAAALPDTSAAPAEAVSAESAPAEAAPMEAAPSESASSESAPADESSSESSSESTTETTTTESTELAWPSYLGILGLYSLPDTERELANADIKRGVGAALLFGKQFTNSGWGYELHGEVTTIETSNQLRTDFYHYKLGGDLVYSFGDRAHFTPFLIGGIGVSRNDVYPNGTVEDGYDFFANAGLGFVTGPITNAGQIRIRGEARYVYDNFGDHYNDVRFGLGIEIPLFEEKVREVATVTETTKVVESNTGLTDSDGDGVIDSVDKCPDTPKGARVDGDGCPFDKVIELKGVTFEFNKTRLRPDAQTILDWAVGVLKKYPDMNVEIAGHTDSVGSDSYNQKLSEGRAQAVKQYFIDHGVPEAQATAKGYGESQPKADNATAEGRELNRRVELRILN